MGHHGDVLTFRLAGIPVTVNPTFLLVAALIGLSGGDLTRVVIWVAVVFVSILVHELGHALTARRFGAEVTIELNGIGGLTTWSGNEGEMTPGRRAVVAAAGSLVGVVFGGAVWAVSQLTGPHIGLVAYTLSNLVWVNVFWGLLNWLPVRPLDGGHLLQSLLQKLVPRRAGQVASTVFFLTSAAALVAALRLRLYLVAILAGWLVMAELTRDRAVRPRMPIPPMSFEDDPRRDGSDPPAPRPSDDQV